MIEQRYVARIVSSDGSVEEIEVSLEQAAELEAAGARAAKPVQEDIAEHRRKS